MSTTQTNKVDEQVPACRPQQNGSCNKNEELELENMNDNDEETIEVEMVVPPDGGWGWVIVFASFMCNLVVDGIIFSFGVFLNDIMNAFDVSKARVALANSLQAGFYLMIGPFVSALANRYGFRLVAILGSIVSCFAFVLSYFSTSIEFLYVSYGCIGGIGAGLIYVPAVITTGFYFERWRALATGIAVCGSGIGAFVLAPLSSYLVRDFGWRGALLFQAGMLLNCALFGAFFRPLKPTRIKVKATPENAALEAKSTLLKKGVSTASLCCEPPNRRSGFFGTNNNTEYPTAAEVLGSNPNVVNTSTKSLHSLHKVLVETQALEKKLSTSDKRLSVPIYPDLEAVNNDEKIAEENNLLSGDLERLNGKVPTTRRHTISGRRLRTDSECSQKSLKLGKRNQPNKDPQRPFYRDDIFYGGSLNRLSHYRSQQSVGYHMSVIRLPTEKDVAEEESGSCYLCPESVRRILTTMLDLSLLKSPSFLILAISGALTMMGFYTPFMYVVDRAIKANVDSSTAGFLISVIGIGNTIGRIVCGLATSIPRVNALMVNNIFISLGGLVTIFSGISLSAEYQFFYAAIFGLSISVFASLRSILVVDLLGLEKLTNAFGLLLLFQGLAATVGSPLAGTFMDATGSYDASFYMSGSLILLSAVICYPLKRINTWERNRVGQKLTAADPSAS